jgi:hypothetical protein
MEGFENKILRRISGCDRRQKKIADEEFHNLYSLLNIFIKIRSRRMR